MDITSLLVFAAAYTAVVALPGPSVTALIARVLARGLPGTAFYIVGIIAGALTWFTVAATGLAAIAAAFAPLFVAIRYAGAAYLLYLAWKFWTAPARTIDAVDASPDGRWRLFLTGLAMHLGNPKAIVFFLALLPNVIPLDRLTLLGFAELAVVIATVVAAVLTAYALAAAHARRLFTSPRANTLINRGGAVVMAGTAAAVAAR
jgi:threonine/homoserine/homoserine lactone efflux protein